MQLLIAFLAFVIISCCDILFASHLQARQNLLEQKYDSQTKNPQKIKNKWKNI